MSRHSRVFLRTGVFSMVLVVLLTVAVGYSHAQTGDQPYYEQLWSWLQRNNYKHWADTLGGDGDFRKGESPHGDLIKTYANRTALSDPDNLPDGSVLVLENYSNDKQLISFNVMQRSEGFDPKNSDWFYATYLPSGTIAKALSAKKGEIAFAGRVASCIECHRNAWDDDFVHFND